MKFSIEKFVYGAIDGAVTTFAIMSGVVGASPSPSIIIKLRFANLLADGFSMAIGNYLAIKTQNEFKKRERKREEWEIDNPIDEEKQETRDMYSKKGFKEDLLEKIVRIITSRRKVWIVTMMREELGLIEGKYNPMVSAANTFLGFNTIGMIPLIPFIFVYLYGSNLLISNALLYSIVATASSFFLIGIIRGKVVHKPIIASGFNTVLIGGAAAAVSYCIGYVISTIIR